MLVIFPVDNAAGAFDVGKLIFCDCSQVHSIVARLSCDLVPQGHYTLAIEHNQNLVLPTIMVTNSSTVGDIRIPAVKMVVMCVSLLAAGVIGVCAISAC